MSDDNLQSVHVNPALEGPFSWEDCFGEIVQALQTRNAVCASVPTISSNGIRGERLGELGSKLFMFDLARMRDRLGDAPASWFLPFFPAKANAFWGEDYYFQLMFQALFRGQGPGYTVLDSTRFGVVRAPLASLCSKVVKTADALCQTTSEGLFAEGFDAPLDALTRDGFEPRVFVKLSVLALQRIIKDNMEVYKGLLERGTTTDLMLAHAWANGLTHRAPEALPAIADESFLTVLREKIQEVVALGQLHDYQKELLDAVCEQLLSRRFIGQFNMATGTGKTYVQIYLAIAALLTGTTRPIVIVTPYRQLVSQAHSDFMAVLAGLEDLPIQASQIIKVDSNPSSVSAETLMKNRTLDNKGCVLITCEDSYQKILASKDEVMAPYQSPCMLLADEWHLTVPMLTAYCELNPNPENAFIACLSATPKEHHALLAAEDAVSIDYSRERAVLEGHLTPIILDTFEGEYSLNHVRRIIDKMPDLIKNTLTPSGGTFADYKGIIYVPNTKHGINYSRRLKATLEAAGIACYEINSDEPDSQENLEAYKNYHKDKNPAKIIICKGMGKVGLSDKEIHWEVYLQKGSAAEFCQSAGRVMRVLNDTKVAHVIAFKDVDAKLVFKGTDYVDEKAWARASEAYKAHRQKTHGKIAIASNAKKRLNTEADGGLEPSLFSGPMTFFGGRQDDSFGSGRSMTVEMTGVHNA